MAAGATPKIHFSVEQAGLARDRKNKDREPFRVDVNGRIIEMTDAADLDWKVLLEIEHPVLFLKYCVSDADRNWLREEPLKGAVCNLMIEAYQKHCNLGNTGVTSKL